MVNDKLTDAALAAQAREVVQAWDEAGNAEGRRELRARIAAALRAVRVAARAECAEEVRQLQEALLCMVRSDEALRKAALAWLHEQTPIGVMASDHRRLTAFAHAIRDAATAAERERACLILEKLRNERGEHSFSAIALDQALAALRGGDHD